MPVFRRVTLKLSGEALSGKSSFGIDQAALTRIAGQIHTVHRTGLQMAIVVGGGNIFRGASAAEAGMERSTADYAGMLATIINALALQDAIERTGIEVRTMSAIHVQQVAEPYIQRRAIHHLETGRIVVFAAGTGNPYMSTDTAAALRAVETGADVLLMAKNNVDGVYDADPSKVPDAQRFDELTYIEALNRRLEVMDSTALSLCMENHLPIVVFAAHGPSGIERAARGEPIGTWVGDVPRRLAEATPKAVGG